MSCCSCHVQACCCNYASLKTGVIIWAIIDMHLTRFEIGMEVPNEFYWMTVVIFADLCLLIGAYTSNLCMIIFWLVIRMINIVGLCLIFLLYVVGVNTISTHIRGLGFHFYFYSTLLERKLS